MPSALHMAGLSVSVADADRSFRLEVDALELHAGEVVGLTGPSGTGKTMLLEVLGLLRRPDQGGRYRIDAGGQAIDAAAVWTGPGAGRRAPDLRGRLFGFVPQSGGLLPFLSVAENIALSQRIAGRVDHAWRDDLMARLGLAPLARLRPDALSIGQRQRVAIARALAHRPPFVIADEPTAALDPDNAGTAISLLIDAARAGGSAVLISTHDWGLLDRFGLPRLRLGLTGDHSNTHVTSALSTEGATSWG